MADAEPGGVTHRALLDIGDDDARSRGVGLVGEQLLARQPERAVVLVEVGALRRVDDVELDGLAGLGGVHEQADRLRVLACDDAIDREDDIADEQAGGRRRAVRPHRLDEHATWMAAELGMREEGWQRCAGDPTARREMQGARLAPHDTRLELQRAEGMMRITKRPRGRLEWSRALAALIKVCQIGQLLLVTLAHHKR